MVSSSKDPAVEDCTNKMMATFLIEGMTAFERQAMVVAGVL